jgi:hypothetical protein
MAMMIRQHCFARNKLEITIISLAMKMYIKFSSSIGSINFVSSIRIFNCDDLRIGNAVVFLSAIRLWFEFNGNEQKA